MKKEIRGDSENERILVENIYYEDRKEFLEEKFNGKITGGVIRISEREYKNINTEKEFITHFNLQVCHHEIGKVYALPKILKQGFYTKEKEQLPNLSFNNIVIGECVEVKEYLKYEELTKNDFEYSFDNIKNSEELKKVVLERYEKSLPDLSNEKILELGVSLTKLRIIK